MQKLELIYKKYNLRTPKLNIFPNDNYLPEDSKITIRLNEKDVFYASENIFRNNLIYYSNNYDQYLFEHEKENFDDYYYSSIIEGVDLRKEKKRNKETKIKDLNYIYNYLFKIENLNEKTLDSFVSELEKNEDKEFLNIREKGNKYRDKDVYIFKSGKHGIDEKIHTGVNPNLLSKSINIVFELMNNSRKDQSFFNTVFNTAISHVLFEYIHPYNDGNGRIGRMLINWNLDNHFDKKSLYISEIISINRNKYYLALEHSQKTKNLNYFISFMFELINESIEILQIMSNILSENRKLSYSNNKFIRKMLILGIHKESICYPMISRYLQGQYSKASFFKNMKTLVEMKIFCVDDSKKTNYYKLNKFFYEE